MHKRSISMQRIRMLLRQEWTVSGRRHLMILSGLAIVLILYMFYEQYGVEAKRQRNVTLPHAEIVAFKQFFSYLNSFHLWFFVAISVFISNAHRAFRDKESTQWYLSVPASNLEKWLSKLIYFLVLIPIITFSLYLLIANFHLAFLSTPGYAIRWLLPVDLLDAYTLFILLSGFFFLVAGIWQARYSWILGILVLAIPNIVYLNKMQNTVYAPSGRKLIPLSFNTEDYFTFFTIFKSGQSLYILGFLFFSLACLFASYIALREKQV